MIIIALVGPFGSGCTYVARIIEKYFSYTYLSLSNRLKDEYKEKYPENEKETVRSGLQNFGNELREHEGCEYLAKKIWNEIEKDKTKNYVIDGIKNPGEIKYFRSMHPEFFLIGIFAEPNIRWKRVQDKYKKNLAAFEEDDIKDSGKNEKNYGQHVTDSFRMADIIILNNDDFEAENDKYNKFKDIIKEKIDIISKKAPFRPASPETFMTMAYAASLMSSCLKRKVGAIIVDCCGNVFSSGCNEVPSSQFPCFSVYAGCYRDKLKKEFRENLNESISNEDERECIYSLFKQNFKILDYCRALHAEENAILNVARIGTSSALSKSTLYTTTYPCNLCANKIAQVGISRIVYFEPYPMEEAKQILLNKGIEQIPFQGVTYNGYFRFMEEIE